MSISVSAAGMLVANVSPPRVVLLQAMGGFELAFIVDGVRVPRLGQQPIIWFRPDLARIRVGAGPLDLGSAHATSALAERTTVNSAPFSCEFRTALSSVQLEAMEKVRNGGDLPFQLMISGVAASEQPTTDAMLFQWVLTHTVPHSDWVEQLRSAKAADILLLEIPMPFVDPPAEMGVVVKTLRQAQRLFLEAHYKDCVTNCRLALEDFEKLVGRDRAGALKPLAADREAMNKEERHRAMEASFFHYCSLPMHDGIAAFDRRDAKLALALVSALIANGMN